MSDMTRREFIALIGAAGLLLAVKVRRTRAQQAAMPVIGYVSLRSADSDVLMVAEFRRGLNEAGYIEGKNVAIEFRWGGGQYDPLPALMEDLVHRSVAIIVTSGGEPAALAAKAATTKIPIVFNIGEDPVRYGLVTSISRPGGNLTGVTSLLPLLGAKQLGLLRELVPKAVTIGMLVNPNDPWAESQIASTQAAAHEIGQELVVRRASTEGDLDAAFAAFVQRQVAALLVVNSPFFVTRGNYLISLAARYALPTLYFRRELAVAGGLISYGSSTAELYGQMGIYTGRILKGEKPADLPVLQPTKFELVINLKTTKALGLTIPPDVLSIADEVIE